MGCSFFKPSNCGSYESTSPRVQYVNVNPLPDKYTVVRARGFKGESSADSTLVVELFYHGCVNFEGRKILVYRGFEDLDLLKKINRKKLDPHFCDHVDHVSPFARFVPTQQGWEIACSFALALSQIPQSPAAA